MDEKSIKTLSYIVTLTNAIEKIEEDCFTNFSMTNEYNDRADILDKSVGHIEGIKIYIETLKEFNVMDEETINSLFGRLSSALSKVGKYYDFVRPSETSKTTKKIS